jgi:hypothetical protein
MKFWRGSRRRNYVTTFSVQFQFNDTRLQYDRPGRFTQFKSLNSTGVKSPSRSAVSKNETVECNLYDLMPELVASST